MQFICQGCGTPWGEFMQGQTPSCPVCHRDAWPVDAPVSAGDGRCRLCGRFMDEGHIFSTTMGSYERACPVRVK